MFDRSDVLSEEQLSDVDKCITNCALAIALMMPESQRKKEIEKMKDELKKSAVPPSPKLVVINNEWSDDNA